MEKSKSFANIVKSQPPLPPPPHSLPQLSRKLTVHDKIETIITEGEKTGEFHLPPQKDIYIDTSSDLHTVHSCGSGAIARVLRSIKQYVIKPNGRAQIETQLLLPGAHLGWTIKNSLVYYQIKSLNNYWLNVEGNFAMRIREGVLSPRYFGRVHVTVYNKLDTQLIIHEGNAIAELETKLCDYIYPIEYINKCQ